MCVLRVVLSHSTVLETNGGYSEGQLLNKRFYSRNNESTSPPKRRQVTLHLLHPAGEVTLPEVSESGVPRRESTRDPLATNKGQGDWTGDDDGVLCSSDEEGQRGKKFVVESLL